MDGKNTFFFIKPKKTPEIYASRLEYLLNPLCLRIDGTYIPKQKFDLIRISVLHDVTIIWKKSHISNMSKKIIFHNNIAKKLLTNWSKKIVS